MVRVVAEVGTKIDALDQGFDAAETDLDRGAGPPSQTPSGQALPQAPQWFGSLERSTQTPPQLVSVSTQAIGGALQIPPSQTPSGQTLPHAPQ